MTYGRSPASWWALFAMLAFAASCKPKYPACENDEHCQQDGKTEVCVNNQCQECRDDTQCEARGPGFTCVAGRCEVKAECRADADCKDNLVCRGQKCVAECTTNEDCPSGRRCEQSRCVAECSADVDCGPGRSCVDGACQEQERDTTKVSAACRPMGGGAGEIIALPSVRFDFNEYDLRVDARSQLDQAAQCMREAPQVYVVLEGHGDERGTQEYNLALGERRAAAVRGYLKNLGIDTGRMTTRSKGENEPLCREATDECYSRNRRVEFIQSVR